MDYPNITISATPHVRSKESTQTIMRDVIIALVPAAVMGIINFGFNALLLMVISIATAVIAEGLYQKATKQKITVSDLSAVVTGLLLAMNLPATAPWWVPIVGSAFAIIFAKQLFGGLGQNFINPALAGRAFLMGSYPTIMTDWITPGVDAVSTATPLGLLKDGSETALAQLPSLQDALLGRIGGCIGETCALALIIGGIYLIVREVISWRIPVVYLATVFVLSAVLGREGSNPVYEIMIGGVMLGAFFMATDYASSPISPKGQIIMGIGCGLLTVLIRVFGGYPEGVSYSILIMNLCVPLIDRFTKPTIFGALPKVKKGAEKA
ncbi:MAG: RnfABCDGE type electron transport complex subunit D [Firmicutes bacterium]|nr:RnfABCDGE type electron transport complex subunit D [Bacillota bacterium]